jgi:hypothetical protein
MVRHEKSVRQTRRLLKDGGLRRWLSDTSSSGPDPLLPTSREDRGGKQSLLVSPTSLSDDDLLDRIKYKLLHPAFPVSTDLASPLTAPVVRLG